MKQLVSVLFFCIGSIALGHGEDKLGPHGGFIKMPGAFHTEVVPRPPSQISVYLLDMNWKLPTVENSEVKLSYIGPKGEESLKCGKKKDYFECTLPSKRSLTQGALDLTAKRLGASGNKVRYDLPLAISSKHGH